MRGGGVSVQATRGERAGGRANGWQPSRRGAGSGSVTAIERKKPNLLSTLAIPASSVIAARAAAH